MVLLLRYKISQNSSIQKQIGVTFNDTLLDVFFNYKAGNVFFYKTHKLVPVKHNHKSSMLL